MCGLVGGNNSGWNYDAALRTLAHRGPDSRATVKLAGMTLGFARLAVVDTSASADQPMLSPDGHTCLLFNGEIYGYRRLRAELQSLQSQA